MSDTRTYFAGLDINGLSELFVSDGTAADTIEIVSPLASAAGLYPSDFTALSGRILFAGTDQQHNVQLWTTDGTPGGTGPVVVTASSANGLQPTDITAFGSGALFAGADPTGIGLFFSDGTTNGTLELTAGDGVQGGPNPVGITTLDSGAQALFAGFDLNGLDQLYTTDGTASGTGVVAVADESGFGLAPSEITAFGIGALFFGADSNGSEGIYVTDGTSAGTTELMAAPANATEADLVVSGSRALFASNNQLAVTDGTVGGTSTLVVANASTSGLQPTDITALGAQVLFSGVDAAGNTGLWTTDGTAAGTAEILPANAGSGGLAPTDITAFGTGALFSGTDAQGLTELWLTNGTAAGTVEIVPAGASTTIGLDPTDITVDGAIALFDGLSANGTQQLWESDGTLAGTLPVQTAAASSNGLQPTDLTTGYFNPACYVVGTRILTDRGEVAVEALAIGDRVITGCGIAEPIKWIGRRSYRGRALAKQPGIAPIRFRAGCLGDGLPRRDLLVSPKHAMLLDGYLVPAEELVNDTAVTREPCLDRVDYVHIELERHDVIVAEGVLSETFLDDDGSRAVFDNALNYVRPFGFPDGQAPFCAPRITHGYALEAIRRRLAFAARPLGVRAQP